LDKSRNQHVPWNWYYLSMNPNITWEIVQSNLDKDWDWWCLSETLYKLEYGRISEDVLHPRLSYLVETTCQPS